MANLRKRYFRRRLAYLPTFFSIALVLFLTGLFGLVLLNARNIKVFLKENVELSIYFRDDVPEDQVRGLQARLEKENYVKSTRFISRDDAVKWALEQFGSDQTELIGYNPFPHSIELKFKEGFVLADSLDALVHRLRENSLVRDVDYQKALVSNIDKYVGYAGLALMALAVLMGLISIGLIYNTIRLTLYSRRFLIKSMQLVGATRAFVRRPFLLRSIILGLVSSLFAGFLLSIALVIILRRFPYLSQLQDYGQMTLLFFILSLLGVGITLLSSYFAVNKYLKMKLDDLF